jgi:hypothetical protein
MPVITNGDLSLKEFCDRYGFQVKRDTLTVSENRLQRKAVIMDTESTTSQQSPRQIAERYAAQWRDLGDQRVFLNSTFHPLEWASREVIEDLGPQYFEKLGTRVATQDQLLFHPRRGNRCVKCYRPASQALHLAFRPQKMDI